MMGGREAGGYAEQVDVKRKLYSRTPVRPPALRAKGTIGVARLRDMRLFDKH